jgi:ubiquinone/menaquinone biosynthesis C-methylase UbiE
MIGDYGTDHQHALDVLEEFLGRHFGRPCLMLEVASGVHPHLLRFAVAGHLVVATDICSNMMQLGALSARHHMRQTLETLGFASADAFDMPFRPGQFDVVALFAALHHFPDPVAFLARLKPLLRAGGVLAVMCEPCDPQTTIVSDGYVRDLAAGINEQVFSVEEYRAMFAKAGLVERAIRNDGGSLKAILAPAAAS